jgi:hypothetical protein
MHERPTIDDDVYQGADTATVALGKGKIYGWAGSAFGIVTGVLTSGPFSASIERYVPRANKLLETLKIPIKPKTAIRTAGGIAGSFIGHYIGLAIGVAVGLKTAHRGRDQFERIKDQRDVARAQVKLLENPSGQGTPASGDAINEDAHVEMGNDPNPASFTAREEARSSANEAKLER